MIEVGMLWFSQERGKWEFSPDIRALNFEHLNLYGDCGKLAEYGYVLTHHCENDPAFVHRNREFPNAPPVSYYIFTKITK